MIGLVSYPKSGNTWIRALLTAYNGHLELNNLVGTHDRKEVWTRIVSPKAELTDSEVNLLRSAALLTLDQVAKPAIIKSHWLYGSYEGIPLFPKSLFSQIIYVVRDPKSVCVSYANHFDKPINDVIKSLNNPKWCLVDDLGLQPLGTWSNHVKTWLECTDIPVHIVRYEDLLRDPTQTFNNILIALGLVPDANRVKHAIELTEFKKLQSLEEKGFNEAIDGKTFFKTGFNDLSSLSTKQIERINHDHKDVLSELY